MKVLNQTIVRYIVIAMLAVLPVWASAVALPETTFQSTSSLAGSGSSLSSTPMLNEDGTATYEGESSSGAPSGPHRIPPVKPSGDPTLPIGDVLCPLLLLALAYAGFKSRKRLSTRA